MRVAGTDAGLAQPSRLGVFSIEELRRFQVRYLQRREALSCQLQEFRVHVDVVDASALERITPLMEVRRYDQCVSFLQRIADVQ